MTPIRDLWTRLREWRDRAGVEREMDEELRFHVDMATRRYIERGLPEREARRLALRDFGGIERHKEEARDRRPTQWLEQAAQDLRYAGRTIRRSPGFASAVILTLALGMGAVTAIFSVVNGVLLRPLPFPDPDRLVYLGWDWGTGGVANSLTGYQLEYVRRHSRAVEGVATYRTLESDVGDPALFRMARGLRVSEDFFRVAGVAPVHGRAFTDAENRPGGEAVAIVSDAFWRRELGGDPAVVGSTLRLGGGTPTVVGVMPPRFRFPGAPEYTDVLLPLRLEPNPRDEGHNYEAFTRLRAGWSRDAAERELESVMQRMRTEHPELFGNPREGIGLLGFNDMYVGELGRTLWMLLAAVGCVLLISCANAANLLLARAVAREREIVVRAALGAGRGRILRQLLIEGIALSIVAGVVGTVVGGWSLSALLSLVPRSLPRADEIGLDIRVLALTAGIIAVTGIMFGLVAALPTSRLDLASSLRERARGGAHRGGLRELLVIAETAFAIVLLAGAGLFIASFARLRGVDPGFSTQSVVAVRYGRMPREFSEERRSAFDRALLERVRAIPGVEAAGGVSNFPLERGMNIPVAIEGRPAAAEGDVEWRAMTPGYLDALEVPLRGGRGFTEGDRGGAPRVAIVNEAFARHFFPNEDPIGQRVEIGKWKGEWLSPGFAGAAEIVGVVADVRELGLDRLPKRTVIVPVAQWPGGIGQTGLVARTSQPSLLEREVAGIVRSIDATVAAPSVEQLSSIVGASIREQRFQMVLLSVFAASALVLTAIGVFAVLSYSVRDRAREIGVRIALGAQAGSVIRLVVGRGLLLVGIGSAIGLAVALLASRLLDAMLYDVTPTDPVVLISAVGLLLAIALVAAWIPARRAALVDPLAALRAE